MPRPERVFFDGAMYHVYNRVARGQPVLEDGGEAERFVELLREVVERDGLTVFAWCVMSHHYHLAVRTGSITLDRPMKSLQQRYSHQFNATNRFFGPLWQGRYRAKLIDDQSYFDQLLVYIHLNPVAAGLVSDPYEYRWSGHREIVGRTSAPIVDVDEVLQLFGRTRRSARARYVRAVKGAVAEEWIGEAPGKLPWWRLGRPPAKELEDPIATVRAKRGREVSVGLADRPRMSVNAFLEKGADWLEVEMEDLAGRGQRQEVVRARELLATLAVERYGFQVKALAETLGKHAVTGSVWVRRGVQRCREDPAFRAKYERLDKALRRQ
jgi:REP element-mobilizing transposase RayT